MSPAAARQAKAELYIDVRSEGPQVAIDRSCQSLANKLQISVSTLIWPETREAGSEPIGLFIYQPQMRWERLVRMFTLKDRAGISRFGWFVVIWAGIVMALLSGALQKNVEGTTRIIFLAMFLFAMIVGIERVRFAIERKRRDRAELRQSAERFS